MTAEAILQGLGLGELLSRDVLGVQLAILGVTIALLVVSSAMMILAARSAGGARKARMQAENCLRSAQDVVVEARQLSAQIDRAAAKAKGDGPAPIRVSARETTPEAEIDIVDLKRSHIVSGRNLDAAKEAASVPKNLLGRSRRH